MPVEAGILIRVAQEEANGERQGLVRPPSRQAVNESFDPGSPVNGIVADGI
jgi:hypothetical protein